jgi:hypothetical protein
MTTKVPTSMINTGTVGTVTQETNKSTGVELNSLSGQITMNAAELAADAVVTFILTNSNISATSNVIITANFVGGPYEAWVYAVESGQCRIAVRNASAGALSNAVVLNFAVLNGA